MIGGAADGVHAGDNHRRQAERRVLRQPARAAGVLLPVRQGPLPRRLHQEPPRARDPRHLRPRHPALLGRPLASTVWLGYR
jgi:hypothetical protein